MPLDGNISAFLKQETKLEPFTLPHFTNWIGAQVDLGRGEETYCWTGHCLIEQYGEAYTDFHKARAYCFANSALKASMGIQYGGEPGSIACAEPHTFSAALHRARHLLNQGKD